LHIFKDSSLNNLSYIFITSTTKEIDQEDAAVRCRIAVLCRSQRGISLKGNPRVKSTQLVEAEDPGVVVCCDTIK
jgi:hypothetical protein